MPEEVKCFFKRYYLVGEGQSMKIIPPLIRGKSKCMQVNIIPTVGP